MDLTLEQKQIVQHNVSGKAVVNVIAFAGTGKTTTLIEYTKLRPDVRFLYLAFNKSVQLEALKKFPRNVTCKTSHSLAWWGFGSKFKKKLVPNLKAITVRKVLGFDNYEYAKFTIDTLTNWLISSDRKISNEHIPHNVKFHFKINNFIKQPDFVALARKLWKLMSDPLDPSVGMLHDGYLKLFQLDKPKLQYDIILLDEAQDTNSAVADIVLSQNCSKLLVGDPHQAIYGFRGARDFLNKAEADKTFYLTKSFRFGENIAKVANMLLHAFKNEEKNVVGNKNGQHINTGKTKFTLIARTNANVFHEAIHLIQKYKISFLGGIAGYRFQRILDSYYLYSKNRKMIKNHYIASFKSFEGMKKYTRAAADIELKSIIRIVEEYTHDIPRYVNEILSKSVNNGEADIILSTAHKSKGHEFEVVKMSDDFPDLMDNGKIVNQDQIKLDEVNLMYVAVTRSKNKLKIAKSSSLNTFIKKYKGLYKAA